MTNPDLSWHLTETYKALPTLAVEALKILALVNGGATVAVLTYLGNLATRTQLGVTLPNMTPPLLWYCGGLVLTIVAFVGAYVTQLVLYDEELARRSGRSVHRYHICGVWGGVALTILAVFAFTVGCFDAAHALGTTQEIQHVEAHSVTIYDFLKDQGSIIAGLLALGAGIAAVIVTRNAGLWQKNALEAQNAELKRQARVDLARQGIVAVRMLSGVIARAEDGVQKLSKAVSQPQYQEPHATLPNGYREMIVRTELAIVWNVLSRCGYEVVDKYLLLDLRLTEFASSRVPGVHSFLNELEVIKRIIEVLKIELEGEAQRCNAILAEYASR
jgi:hypothetical protein